MASDENAAVRFRVALAVSELGEGNSERVLASILRRDPGDEWIRAAVFAGSRQNSLALLDLLLGDRSFMSHADSLGAVKQLAANVAASEPPEAVVALLSATGKATGPGSRRIRMAAASGIAAGLERKGSSLPLMLDDSERPELREAIAAVLAEAPSVAVDRDGANVPERTEAIGLLSWAPQEDALTALGSLLTPDEPAEIQLAAVRSLSLHTGQHVGRILVDSWRSYSPAVRREAVEVLFSREGTIAAVPRGSLGRGSTCDSAGPNTADSVAGAPAARASAGRRSRSSPARQCQALRMCSGNIAPPPCRRETRAGGPRYSSASVRLAIYSAARATRWVRTWSNALRPRGMNCSSTSSIQTGQCSRTMSITGLMPRTEACSPGSSHASRKAALPCGEVKASRTSWHDRTSNPLISMGLSLMPEGLEDEIDPAEMSDLLSFLKSHARQ